jgi:hypothetical protein
MSTASRVNDLALATATRDKLILTLISGNVTNLSALTTTDKTNLVAALNEIKAIADAAGGSGGVGINDTATNTTETWSSSKISGEISAAIAALVGGAPGALDTLNELAEALADDAAFSATVTTALANRVRFDAAQTLTSPQQTQARANTASMRARGRRSRRWEPISARPASAASGQSTAPTSMPSRSSPPAAVRMVYLRKAARP